MGEERTARARVEVQDPKLSPEANRILSEETREALGTDEVEVSESRAEGLGREDLAEQGSPLSSNMMRSRVLVGMTVAAAVVIAAILLLVTGDWPWLLLAVAVLLAAVVFVTFGQFETTTNVEQPSPQRVDTLEREGVRDPEEVVNTAVRQFAGAQESATDEATDTDASRPFEEAGTGTIGQQVEQTPSSSATESEGQRGES